MAGMLLLIVVVVGAVTALATVGLIRSISGRRGLSDAHGLLWQLAGLVVGFWLCAVVELLDGPRHPLVLSLPALAGCCWLLGLIAAERTRRRRQSGAIRVAGLVPRTLSRYVARWARVSMRAAFLAAALLALAAWALGSQSDSTLVSATAMNGITRSHGPWPGWYYSVPALIGLACGWVLTEWAIRAIAGRAPVADPDADGQARVQATRAALTAACLMALPVLGGLLLTMGAGLESVSPSALARGIAWAMGLIGGVMLFASAVAWLSALVSGGRAVVPRVGEP